MTRLSPRRRIRFGRWVFLALGMIVAAATRPAMAASWQQPGNLLANPGFERGLVGWMPSWAAGKSIATSDAGSGCRGRRCLKLVARDTNVGVDGKCVYAGIDFDKAAKQVVSAYVLNRGIARGGFGLRLYARDAKGKSLAMKGVGGLNPGSPSGGWRRVRAEIGPGTGFELPKGTDHLLVRLSFWAKDGHCEGGCLIDDVFLGRPVGERPATSRPWKRSQAGTIGVWKDNVPVVGKASDTDRLASVLGEAGFGVNLLTTEALTDCSVLDADQLDLLILPYGESFPAAGANPLRRFLRRGGHLISLGGRCFRAPIYRSPRGWSRRTTSAPTFDELRSIFEISGKSAASLASAMGKGEQPAEVSLSEDSAGRPALCVVVPNLRTYKYVPFNVKGSLGYGTITFRARGDEDTKHLCIELNGVDGSRWKAVVPLSTRWETYAISTGQFASYATPGRGGRGDFPRAERVRRVAFGFPTSLVGTGRRSFAISQIAWRRDVIPPAEVACGSLAFDVPSHLIQAFGSELKHPSATGDVTAFFASERFDATSLKAAPGGTILPEMWTIQGDVSGWTATALEDNQRFLWRGGASRVFLPTERWARRVPLLVTPLGTPGASLFVNVGGRYAGSNWACFGVTSHDVFARRDAATAGAVVKLVDRLLNGVFLTRIEPRFEPRGGRVRVTLAVGVSNASARDQAVELYTRFLSMGSGEPSAEGSRTVKVGAGESRDVVALDADARSIDWKGFRADCRLSCGGRAVDRIATLLDVRGTLLAVCDRFVRTQRERGDGKFSGVAFVDNRGARALLAAFDLTGNKAYLDAAVAWADAIMAEQRSDGGYLMGYGYHPDGDECFVADGGEIACGIGRLIGYVPPEEGKRLITSLRSYMKYRESFRCEGGGIGVGWCRSDYGARPVKRLDKLVKIFAPERNIYTIGCTLTAATMHARLTRDRVDNDAAVRDAHWWLERCTSTCGGAYVESAVWAHKLLEGGGIKQATERFLRSKFVPHVVVPGRRWWTEGGGRTVQGIDGLAYYYDCIEKDPEVLAALMRSVYHVCSAEALSGIPRVLAREELSGDEWRYLHFAAVSLPDLLSSEVMRKRF